MFSPFCAQIKHKHRQTGEGCALHIVMTGGCMSSPSSMSLSQFKSPGSCSSHVASSARPESAHPPILLPWHFQENPSRLGACLINPRERRREGGWEGERVCCADLAGIVLSAGGSTATDTNSSRDNCYKPNEIKAMMGRW